MILKFVIVQNNKIQKYAQKNRRAEITIPPLFAKYECVRKSYDWNYGKQK